MPTATQQVSEWKVGDKAFFDHNEVTIKRTNGPNGTYDVCTEWIERFAEPEELFPISDGGRMITTFYEEQYDLLHKMEGNRLLNHPVLCEVVHHKYNETMRLQQAGDKDGVRRSLMEATLYFNTIHGYVKAVLSITLEGHHVFLGWK